MNIVAQILAGAMALVLFGMWIVEAFLHRSPRMYPLLLIEQRDTAAVRMWAICVGFYNLCWALGIAAGLILLNTPWPDAGRGIVLFCLASHVVSGVVLYFASDRRLWRSALGESLLPLAAIAAFLAWG